MSDAIKHECGIALLRLKKPLQYYYDKYGTAFYGLNKLHLLMEKQHNRGQDGAGLANIKLDMEPGERYISRFRSTDDKPIREIFNHINGRFAEIQEKDPELLNDVEYLKKNAGFTGELFLGHLRYGTFGRNAIENCHPFLRQNNWITRNLVVAGNFNLTKVDELFEDLLHVGQHPKEKSDTVTVLEKIGHFLDMENDEMYNQLKPQGYSNAEIYSKIAESLDIEKILKKASSHWDGGYAMAGLLGHGDSFVFRDPVGIRPAFYYKDDEVVVVASERPAIQTVFNVPFEEIKELDPGHALLLRKDGYMSISKILEPLEKKSCSFERIYFSRGSDAEIYQERKNLGKLLMPKVLKAIKHDTENTVFSFIPNTAETSFYGMLEAAQDELNKQKNDTILKEKEGLTNERLQEILSHKIRTEKIAIKDVKLRTFITEDSSRDDLVAHVYDVTYGVVRKEDNLVIIDDSIVRGTTLKKSILKMLDRLKPKKIVVVSSAPQIRYPDCYGIDMARLEALIAFQGALALHKDRGTESIVDTIYKKCKDQEGLPDSEQINHVKELYAPFTDEEISDKIAEIISEKSIAADVKVIFQSVDDLHKACPDNLGDWYFTGNYPTPGGYRVVNKAYINFIEGNPERAY